MSDYDSIPPLASLTATVAPTVAHMRAAAVESVELAAADGPAAGANNAPMVLCVEVRLKHQNVLRSYLTKHGFRVLMFSDLTRAVSRTLNVNPPAAIIIMGDGIGDEVLQGFQTLCEKSLPETVTCLLVVSEKQPEVQVAARRFATRSCRVLAQPLTLRDLHEEIRAGLIRTGHMASTAAESINADE